VSNLRRGLFGLGAVAVVVGAFAAGVWADQSFPEDMPLLAVNTQSRASLDQGTIDQALRIIQANYYNPHLDSQALTQGSLQGMVHSLGDPWSQYLSPSQYRQQQAYYASEHSGMIGIYVEFQGGYPVVAGVLPGSPALRAGLQTGDVIQQVDGRDVHGLSAQQASALIEGPVGSRVTLVVERGGRRLLVPVTRGRFQSPTVVSARLPGDVLYIRIYEFGDTTQQEFDQRLKNGLPGSRGAILDLRDNGGGYVSAATAVISAFISKGVAYEQVARSRVVERADVSGDALAPRIPLVVLVNQNTASAAEIVAGALQVHHRAKLVGTRTFGKGSEQVDYPLANGGDLHLTVAHWYLPDGRSVGGHGLQPNVTVALPNPQSMFDPVEPQLGWSQDAQLVQALDVLRGEIESGQ
jgi:carboxyl-terminal processing protease